MQVLQLATAAGQEARQTALDFLKRPEYHHTAISLYGRLAYGDFADVSYLITNRPGTTDVPRIYAFLDRSRRPETELWLFGEWEARPDDFAAEAIQEVLRLFFRTVSQLDLPPSIHAGSAKANGHVDEELDHSGLSRNDYTSHAGDSNIILCGALHERTSPYLREIGLLKPEFKRVEVPFLTYTFDIEHLPSTTPLPQGLRWGKLLVEHMDLVRSRTLIPRQASTMMSVPSVGMFEDGSDAPMAWGFIGVDGSLSTLHVEPDFRGRGLAKILTHKLLSDRMEGFFVGGAARVGHGHVAHENEASRRLCESVGGKTSWSVYWARIDLSQADR